MHQGLKLIHAAQVVDADGIDVAPGALLVDDCRIIAAASPQAIGEVTGADVVDCSDSVIMPGLVNVHAHLDLTHIGPVEYTGDFTEWINRVRAERAGSDSAIEASVREGARLARAGGTAFIGDIAGARSLSPVHALRQSGLRGVSYLEVFGLGRRQELAVSMMRCAIDSVRKDERGVRLGIQPHAPYSCGRELYCAAAALGVPLATHLAETMDELRFVRSGDGPLKDMLSRIGVWDETIRGHDCHPVEFVACTLGQTPFVAAHVNYVDDAALEQLAATAVTVAYCPRASAYFGHRNHRYRDMLAAGINVALSTDSLLCLDTPDRISILDEMRLLHQRDGVDGTTLLAMATVNGAAALGEDPKHVTLSLGPTAGLIAVRGKSLADVLTNNNPITWLYGGNGY